MATISVIDYGMGNIHSVAKALEKVSDRKDKIYITSSIKEIKEFNPPSFELCRVPRSGAASRRVSRKMTLGEFVLRVSHFGAASRRVLP